MRRRSLPCRRAAGRRRIRTSFRCEAYETGNLKVRDLSNDFGGLDRRARGHAADRPHQHRARDRDGLPHAFAGASLRQRAPVLRREPAEGDDRPDRRHADGAGARPERRDLDARRGCGDGGGLRQRRGGRNQHLHDRLRHHGGARPRSARRLRHRQPTTTSSRTTPTTSPACSMRSTRRSPSRSG